jgi:CheY-like chemotaxis protein/HPt (histidine-containing phosphotransfer) domain-containing protein
MNARPSILLVEDDPTSARFLSEVLEGVPANVVLAGSVAAALEQVGAGRHFALWLVDANLPDGRAEDLLAQFRAGGDARIPALALTADAFPERHDSLRAAGFLQVLVKPIEGRTLLAAVRTYLGAPAGSVLRVREPAGTAWDDAQALHAVGGNPQSVAALRALFAQELPADRDRVLAAIRDKRHAELDDTLHRLKASCGFVGAVRLLAAVHALSADPGSVGCLEEFEAACRSTLAGG